MNESDNSAPVPRPPGALEKAGPRAKHILSGIVADTLAQAKQEQAITTKPLRIVMLDDDLGLLELFEGVVRVRFKDATVLKFQDAEEALRELAREEPDIFTTDWGHGELSGDELLPLLAERSAAFPILVISGSATEEVVRKHAGQHLNVTFLEKPFPSSSLVSALEAALKIPHVEQQTKAVSSPDSPATNSPR